MAKQSAGILLYRFIQKRIEFLLVHPGGPFWKNKDEGAWSIPKGETEPGEDPLTAAKREFFEETGHRVSGDFITLTPVTLKSGKVIHLFAAEGDLDISLIKSNNFSMEWPPASGIRKEFPEIDRGEWFDQETAGKKINESQAAALVELAEHLQIPNK